MPPAIPKNLFIVENETDTTGKRIHEEAKKMGLDSQYYHYSDLFISDINQCLESIKTDKNTIGVFFWPFAANNINRQFEFVLEKLMARIEPDNILNQRMMQKSFLFWEDKHCQSLLFKSLNLPHAKQFFISDINEDSFPLIAKKRISSRCKNNFILLTWADYQKFIKKNDSWEFTFQQYHQLIGDYRVFVCRGEVLYIAKRTIVVEPNQEISVKIDRAATLKPAILQQCEFLAKSIGCDLSGIDIGIKQDGSHFFIEHNGRPQIDKSEIKLNRNIAQEILLKIIR